MSKSLELQQQKIEKILIDQINIPELQKRLDKVLKRLKLIAGLGLAAFVSFLASQPQIEVLAQSDADLCPSDYANCQVVVIPVLDGSKTVIRVMVFGKQVPITPVCEAAYPVGNGQTACRKEVRDWCDPNEDKFDHRLVTERCLVEGNIYDYDISGDGTNLVTESGITLGEIEPFLTALNAAADEANEGSSTVNPDANQPAQPEPEPEPLTEADIIKIIILFLCCLVPGFSVCAFFKKYGERLLMHI